MSDVLERLQAANPVTDCLQPDWEGFRRRFDERYPPESSPVGGGRGDIAGRRGALRHTRSWRIAVAAAAFAVVVTIVAVAGRTGGGISLVQRAYAATDPAGGIVYYATSTRSTFGVGGRSSTIESHAQVWRSGLRSRRVETVATHLHNGQASSRGSYEQATERVGGGEINSSYSSLRNAVFKGFLAFRGGTSPESVNCRLAPSCSLTTEDPVVALHRLYAAGRVHEAGHAQLNGETLTVLEAGSVRRVQPAPLHFTRLSPSARILVDAKTGAPVELTTRLGPFTTTTIFHEYRHLELTPQTERLLSFRSHPHARIECVPALHCGPEHTVK